MEYPKKINGGFRQTVEFPLLKRQGMNRIGRRDYGPFFRLPNNNEKRLKELR